MHQKSVGLLKRRLFSLAARRKRAARISQEGELNLVQSLGKSRLQDRYHGEGKKGRPGVEARVAAAGIDKGKKAARKMPRICEKWSSCWGKKGRKRAFKKERKG